MVLEDLLDRTAHFVSENKSFCFWTSALVISGIADIAMTTHVAKSLQDEGNPIMSYLWEHAGVGGMAGMKAATISNMAYVSYKVRKEKYLILSTVAFSGAALSWYLM